MYNLLFVDDELEVLESVKRVLSWDKLKVRVIGWCDNALDALELMVNEHVDILITDVKMPVMDGLELVNRAKAMYPDIKCLVLSGYGEFTLAQSAISLGVKGYLLKPCEKEILEENIKKCVELIEKERLVSSDQFEQRQMQIEELYDELMELKLGEENNDKETVRKIALRYRDFSILRSAIMMAFIQHGQSMQSLQEIARELVHIKDSEEIIRCAVGLLREISKNSGGDDPIVSKMVQYVYANYNVERLTLQEVADAEMHMSSRYIGHKFMEKMGMRFSDFLTKVRMEKAKELLRGTKYYTSDEIANRVGLGNNVRYFYRLFREYTGMTAKEYREKMTDGESN